MAVTKIDEFEVMYSANQFAPRIWLKNSGKFFGQLIFQANGAVLPPDTIAGSQVNLHYHLDDFANVIDLLRNESPMYLLFNGSGGGFENGIQTTQEAPGKGEKESAP